MIMDSLEKQIGRFLIIGFDGEEFSSKLKDLLLEIRPGGIILFKRNVSGGPKQVASLINACRNLAASEFDHRLLVAIDQEGGTVKRLAPPFSQFPGQRELAEKMSAEQVREIGAAGARELSAVGINFNLAPVLDICTDPEANFMADRSFGSDPDTAAEYGKAIIDGHAEHGVLTCLKHFPGIGDTHLDPHYDLPTVNHSLERMRRFEMKSFGRVIKHGAAAVMTSHIRYPGLDPEWPATFSKTIITDLLRDELGFNGLVLTDDMEMGALVKHFPIGEAVVKSIAAGSDLALICHKKERILSAKNALVKAVNSGYISRQRINESLERFERMQELIKTKSGQSLEEVFNFDQ